MSKSRTPYERVLDYHQVFGTEAGQRVLLDFNHPLAGQALTFEVQIIGIL